MEQYIGVDLHKQFFQACAVNPIGERLWEMRFPRTDGGLALFRARCCAETASKPVVRRGLSLMRLVPVAPVSAWSIRARPG
jgi:hypothetical protein